MVARNKAPMKAPVLFALAAIGIGVTARADSDTLEGTRKIEREAHPEVSFDDLIPAPGPPGRYALGGIYELPDIR